MLSRVPSYTVCAQGAQPQGQNRQPHTGTHSTATLSADPTFSTHTNNVQGTHTLTRDQARCLRAHPGPGRGAGWTRFAHAGQPSRAASCRTEL